MSKGLCYEKEIFNKSISTLKLTSKDNRDQRMPRYMTQSTIEVFDFDVVKELYCDSLMPKASEQPRSVDALLLLNNGRSVMVEFKNGKINAKKSYEIHQKVLDSLLILFDLTGLTLSDTRINFDFVLVYSGKDNENGLEKGEQKNNSVQASQSRESILNSISKKAKEKVIRFNLRKLEHYCFDSVHTCTEKEFERDFVQVWNSKSLKFLNVLLPNY